MVRVDIGVGAGIGIDMGMGIGIRIGMGMFGPRLSEGQWQARKKQYSLHTFPKPSQAGCEQPVVLLPLVSPHTGLLSPCTSQVVSLAAATEQGNPLLSRKMSNRRGDWR